MAAVSVSLFIFLQDIQKILYIFHWFAAEYRRTGNQNVGTGFNDMSCIFLVDTAVDLYIDV